MSKIIIGCDPDSDKSGFAHYVDGKLCRLECKSLIDIYTDLESLSKYSDTDIELHIENVNGISSNAFRVNKKDSLKIKIKMAENVGKSK